MPKRRQPNEFIIPPSQEARELASTIERDVANIKHQLEERQKKLDALSTFLKGEGYDNLVSSKILDRAEDMKALKRIGDDESTGVALAVLEDLFEALSLEGSDYREMFSEVETPLKDLIQRLFTPAHLKRDVESVNLVYQNTLKKMEKGSDFLDALFESLDERELYAEGTPSVRGVMDTKTGSVEPQYPKRR